MPQEEDVVCYVLKTSEFAYHPFCDDFGPMNFASIVQFIETLDTEADHRSPDAILCTSEGTRGFTNAAFLLGAYMLLSFNMSPDEIAERFSSLDSSLIEPYRDATSHPSDFDLSLLDCWGGIQRAMQQGWLARPSAPESRLWGRIDADRYSHYDEPLNADLHEIVPGKLVAFRTPRRANGAADRDARNGVRHFTPAYFLPILGELGVSDVVQLNAGAYVPADLAAAGVAHHDLAFSGCVPPLAAVRGFLAAVAAAPGSVAIHCESGLGSTGTLIAVYLMKHHGFTAREAMGWLRVMRPGSVLGDQQHYLVAVERRLQQQRAEAYEGASTRPAPAPNPPPAPTAMAPSPPVRAATAPPPPVPAATAPRASFRPQRATPLDLARSAVAEALAGSNCAAALR